MKTRDYADAYLREQSAHHDVEDAVCTVLFMNARTNAGVRRDFGRYLGMRHQIDTEALRAWDAQAERLRHGHGGILPVMPMTQIVQIATATRLYGTERAENFMPEQMRSRREPRKFEASKRSRSRKKRATERYEEP